MAVAQEVKTIVQLLMKRPITETIATQVEAIAGFEHLAIADGEWVGFDEDEYIGGEEHGWIESLIVHALTGWVLQNRAGRIYTGDTNFVLDGTPDDIRLNRRPDVAFVRDENVRPSKGYIYTSPDLAVEIVSPSERPGDIRKKLREYLDHGVQQVWQVYPDSEEILVHYPDGTAKTYRSGDLLPGFLLAVVSVFNSER